MFNWLLWVIILAVLADLLGKKTPRRKRSKEILPRMRPQRERRKEIRTGEYPVQFTTGPGDVKPQRKEPEKRNKEPSVSREKPARKDEKLPEEERSDGGLFAQGIGEDEVVLGVIMSEVLSPPRAKRPYRYRWQ